MLAQKYRSRSRGSPLMAMLYEAQALTAMTANDMQPESSLISI